MLIERLIYEWPNVTDAVANIEIYIFPCGDAYTLFIQTLSLNDRIFHINIENVKHMHVKDACILVLNTLHMYWMSEFICNDVINDDVKIVPFSSDVFDSVLDCLTSKDFITRSDECLKGEIIVDEDGALSFEWTRPDLHSDDNGDGTDLILFNERFENLVKSKYRKEQPENAPSGFKYPHL